jgi:hypothetical protein
MYSADPAREWGRVASEGYDWHFVPWDQGRVYREPQVHGLARCLAAEIDSAASRLTLQPTSLP